MSKSYEVTSKMQDSMPLNINIIGTMKLVLILVLFHNFLAK